jgi:hypothetical protein
MRSLRVATGFLTIFPGIIWNRTLRTSLPVMNGNNAKWIPRTLSCSDKWTHEPHQQPVKCLFVIGLLVFLSAILVDNSDDVRMAKSLTDLDPGVDMLEKCAHVFAAGYLE